jgi:hypothetical protein
VKPLVSYLQHQHQKKKDYFGISVRLNLQGLQMPKKRLNPSSYIKNLQNKDNNKIYENQEQLQLEKKLT